MAKVHNGGVETSHTVWSWRDIILATVGTLSLGTVATVVTAVTVVIGGGLLLFSPLLLLFSPILVPAVIFFGLLAGGATLLVGGTVLFLSFSVWLYRYLTGGRPYGSDSADVINHKTREAALYAKNEGEGVGGKARDAVREARERASETANSAYGYLQGKTA